MPLYHTDKDHCSLLLWHCTSDDCQTPIYHTPSVSNQLLRYIKCLLRQPEALRPPSPLCLLLRDLKNVRNWSLSTQSSLGSSFVTPLWLWHKALGWVVQSLLFLTHLYFFRYGLVFTPAYSIELCHGLDRTQLSIQITVYQAVSSTLTYDLWSETMCSGVTGLRLLHHFILLHASLSSSPNFCLFFFPLSTATMVVLHLLHTAEDAVSAHWPHEDLGLLHHKTLDVWEEFLSHCHTSKR